MDEKREQPRVMGPVGATLMSVNGMVGAGIFALPGILYAKAGAFSPWMFLIFGLLYSAGTLVSAKLAAMFRSSGGPQLYVQVAFGPLSGFLAGWFLVIAIAAGRAATLYVLVSYLAVFFPVLDDPVIHTLSVLFLLAALSAITAAGTRQAVGGMIVGTILKLTPILVLCVAALASGGFAVSYHLPGFGTFQSVALLVFFAYSGAANAAFAAGEVKKPRRTIPLTMLGSLAAIIAIYMLVQWAYIAAGAPVSGQGSGTDTPLSAAAGVVFGEAGRVALALAAIFSISTNALSFFVSGAQVIYGMADRGLLPQPLARISPSRQTPLTAIALFTAIVALISLTGSFAFLATVNALSAQFVALATFSAFVLFLKQGRHEHSGGLTPQWLAVVAVAAGFSIYTALQAPLETYGVLVVLLAIGGALYHFARSSEINAPAPILE